MQGLTDEESEIVLLVREFVDREVRPVASELEHANAYPERLIEQMKELGVYGLAIPEPWGDGRVSAACFVLVTEELARGWMSLAGAMGGHTVVAKLLLDYGIRQQQDSYLPRMATGELRATMPSLSRVAAPTCRRSARSHGATATAMSSTGRRRGSPTRVAPDSSPCCARPTPQPSLATG